MDKKKVAKNVLTHPCLVAIYLGLICMVTQVKLPAVITATVKYLGDCNSALTMLIVGTILADVKITTIFNKDTAMFSVFRLIILPAAALVVGLGLDAISLGISVLMTPACLPELRRRFLRQDMTVTPCLQRDAWL